MATPAQLQKNWLGSRQAMPGASDACEGAGHTTNITLKPSAPPPPPFDPAWAYPGAIGLGVSTSKFWYYCMLATATST